MSSREENEAINLLSLDGGGVRGVASLLILHEIMVKIQEIQGLDEVPKPCDYFHMIGGTSTGGLIAIMLGRLRMSTEEALREYDHCAKKIFSFSNKKWSRATEKFRATALQDAIQDLVRRRDMGERLHDGTLLHNSKGQCFVCTMPSKEVGQPWRLRSFRSEFDEVHPDVKIWEAARATTAATYFFKPMPLSLRRAGTEDFIDAAIGCNNPVEYLIKEATDRIGSAGRLGCVVSIGTGTRLVQMGRASAGLRNIFHFPRFVKELVGTLKNTATDGEEAHRRVLGKLGKHSDAYFRFNVPGVADEVRLHDHRKINTLKVITATHLDDPSVASQLLAAANALGRNSSEHGLSLGHIDGIDKDQIILTNIEVLPIGDISRFFTGRDDVLAQLDACFPIRDTNGKPRREFLLHGMGGVGKTQIALKAADDLEKRFKFIFIVDGTNTLTAAKWYAKICEEHCQQPSLGCGTTEELKNVALKWMGDLSEEWLLIYDNHPDDEHLKPVLPSRHSGNIIYTSRSRGFLASLPADCVCEIKPLAESHAVDLLLGISGREHFRSDEGEMKSAHELVAQLGHLPLAIESAGAYIRQREISVFTYLEAFRGQAQRSALLNNPQSDSSLPARPGLYTALDLSYNALSTVRRRQGTSVPGMTARFALKALNLLCFYHCEQIPVMMIGRAATERCERGGRRVFPLRKLADPNDPDTDASELLYCQLPKSAWDPRAFTMGARLLQRFSLVKYTPGKALVSMHVMVQEWALDRMKPENRPRQALMARIVLTESLKLEKTLDNHMFLRLMAPHVHACLSHETATGILHTGYQSQLDIKLGLFYKDDNRFPAAAECLARSASICEADSGPNSRATTFGLGMLANVYRDMGRWRDAERIYRDVIQRLHSRRQQTAAADEGLAPHEAGRQSRPDRDNITLELTTPKWTAKALEEAAVAVASGASNETKDDEPETTEDWADELAAVGADLGLALLEQGRFGAAKKCWMQSINLLKEAGSTPEGPDLRIWILEDELKLHFEPEDVQHWNQRITDQKAMPRHMIDELLMLQSGMLVGIGFATAMLETGRPKDGYDVYQSGLRSTTRFYGASDRMTLMLMRNMVVCQMELGNFEEAEELARTTLERARACYGQHHLQTAECLLRLSQTIRFQTLDWGPGSKYWSIIQEAYDSARTAFSDDHYLAIEIKKRIDRARKPPESPGESPTDEQADADAQEFFDALKEAVGKAGPLSDEDFQTLKNDTYREWLRTLSQAEVRTQTPQDKGTASQEVEGVSNGAPAQEQETLGKTARRKRKPKTKHKKKKGAARAATTMLSPILEGDT